MRCRKIKKMAAAIVVIFLLAALAIPALAFADEPDFGRRGSITLTLTDRTDATHISGAEISIIKVAEATGSDGMPEFVPVADFADYSFDDLEDAALAKELAARVYEKGLAIVPATTDSGGVVSYADLDLGVYLVIQTKTADGYSAISPFLIAIPVMTDGGWEYDITGEPKAEPRPVPNEELINISVKKVWEEDADNTSQRPAEVKVCLMQGTAVEQTAILNESNNWEYTWTGLSKSISWNVTEMGVPEGYDASYLLEKEGGQYTYTVTNTAQTPQNHPSNPSSPTATPQKQGTVTTNNSKSGKTASSLKQQKLPQTGQLNWPVPILALCGFAVLMIGVFLVFGRRDGKDA